MMPQAPESRAARCISSSSRLLRHPQLLQAAACTDELAHFPGNDIQSRQQSSRLATLRCGLRCFSELKYNSNDNNNINSNNKLPLQQQHHQQQPATTATSNNNNSNHSNYSNNNHKTNNNNNNNIELELSRATAPVCLVQHF
ncbi:unnamed protein product [Polarella glacialis]|uniref:Uncharacterized protein n=1 Tax=Polarella glacialis TaxID=89957 RepID=A0A813JPG3_POLGL|nr:unnamed protein product [Polarella glacialis]